MPRKPTLSSLELVEAKAPTLAESLSRLDAALAGIDARLHELAAARQAKRVEASRVKPATQEIRPGTGSLRLAAGARSPEARAAEDRFLSNFEAPPG